MAVNGEPDGPPIKPGATIGDTGTGMLCAMDILGALFQRVNTGRGQHIQIAMRDAIINYCRTPMSKQVPLKDVLPRSRQYSARLLARRALPLQTRRARRLLLHFHLARQRTALAPPDRSRWPRGSGHRSAPSGWHGAMEPQRGSSQGDHRLDQSAHQRRGDGMARRSEGAVRRTFTTQKS